MSNAPHTLTIEYIDAQGQLQRTEQLSGEHFTLRVQSEALSVLATAEKAEPADLSLEATPSPWQRIKPWLLALILFGIFALLHALDQWIEYSPDDSSKNLVTQSLGMIGAIALWAAFWAMLGKIFAKHAHYWRHICLVLGAGIALSLVMAAMHFLSFSFSWRMLGKVDLLISAAALSLLAWAHLRLIVPATRHFNLRLFMIVFTLSSVALLMWTNHRRQGTVLDRLHAPHLYRPALQFSSPSSSQDFFKQAQSLEATLKARAQETEPGEDNIGDEE
jgi:MFS family permease